MLRQASLSIAQRSDRFTAVARSLASLQDLGCDLPAAGERWLLPLNWDEPDRFLASLDHHVQVIGIPTLVVAWIHDMSLGKRVAELFSTTANACDFFHILGSASANPAVAVSAPLSNASPNRLAYHRVILGFRRTQNRSRWLTNAEISNGVLDAIVSNKPQHVVGQIEPWGQRPNALAFLMPSE